MTDAALSRQLLLEFDPVRQGRFLEAPSNEAACAWLARTPEWPQRRLSVFGETGSGKSHLLRAWTRSTGATLLHGAEIQWTSDFPDGLASSVAVDDADQASDQPLLHLLNTAVERGMWLLLAARTPPARWAAALPDLTSRLRSIASVGLLRPDDTLLRAMLAALAEERQLVIPDAVADILLTRLPRDGVALRDAVERLDRLALLHGRAIRPSLAHRLLQDMGVPIEDDAAADPPDPDLPRA